VIPLRDSVKAKSKPFINWALIAACCNVFYRELRIGSPEQLESFIRHWAVVPVRFWNDPIGQVFSLATAEFLHGGWAHLIGNMLFLYVFGDSVEDRMGHFRYLIFYLAVGMVANWVQAFVMRGTSLPLLGASGAIAGVLGAYFFYYPYAKVLTLIPLGIFFKIAEIPAFFFLGFWFLMQAMQGAWSMSLGVKTLQNAGGVAWWAHASGFVAGMLAGPALSRKKTTTRR
jgi:membrane associated rhomboid family serine protease